MDSPKNNKHKFKYLSVEESPYETWFIWGDKKKGDSGLLAIFYDLDLALQTAYFLDEVFDYNT